MYVKLWRFGARVPNSKIITLDIYLYFFFFNTLKRTAVGRVEPRYTRSCAAVYIAAPKTGKVLRAEGDVWKFVYVTGIRRLGWKGWMNFCNISSPSHGPSVHSRILRTEFIWKFQEQSLRNHIFPIGSFIYGNNNNNNNVRLGALGNGPAALWYKKKKRELIAGKARIINMCMVFFFLIDFFSVHSNWHVGFVALFGRPSVPRRIALWEFYYRVHYPRAVCAKTH